METLVLLSGGLDSAVLLAHEAALARVASALRERGTRVGAGGTRGAGAVARSRRSWTGAWRRSPALEFGMRDVYSPSHWAIRGTPPAYDTPDEDVYLAGRNLVLLTKAGVGRRVAEGRPHRARPARRKPVSRCHAGVLPGDGASALARAESPRGDRHAVHRDGQRGRHQDRRDAWRAPRAHAVVHESRGGRIRCRSTAGCAASVASGATRSRRPV